jgi:hypothetical protein
MRSVAATATRQPRIVARPLPRSLYVVKNESTRQDGVTG